MSAQKIGSEQQFESGKDVFFDVLEGHDWKVSIGGRTITNLWFADEIDTLAEEEQELDALAESLDKTCTRYKMELKRPD